ncbi:IS1380 family transposase [Mycobacterium sp.]|uniref:IS1380 family transposase n=1 Tax=Mycobacterium sp. TaxID=1785 RepID=UPI003F98E6B2
MRPVSRRVDRIGVTFDEPNLVANAGLLLVATLVGRLDLERLINATVRLAGRVGGALPGRKVLTLVHTMVAGGSHIDHADVLRSGATSAVLPHRVMAPSTLGTFLRAFTFGHVRQFDSVLAEALRRAWLLGAGPGAEQMVMDLDSTICEVCGKAKAGAGYGYTHVLGYHPLLATRSDTGEVLHARLRRGGANTSRGTVRFVEELVARVRRAGAAGELIMRFDSGFWSNRTIAALERLEVGFTMGVRMQKSVVSAISAIDPSGWTPIEYTCDGEAEVAECDYKGRRLIVRRTRLIGRQATLWPEWRHFAFVTDLEGDAVDVDAFHRAHANVELAIRDLKEGAGLEHVPSGHFFANAAWLVCAALAHDLIRWTAMLGNITPKDRRTVARTVRTRFFSVPGRLVSRSGSPTLRTPLEWPWADAFLRALHLLRSLPPVPT